MHNKWVYNHPNLKPRRKQLRNTATDTEKILWTCLKNSKLGYKFVRQYSIEGYVIDFYCPLQRLGIEVDGGVHQNPSQKTYDQYRTRYLKALEITVLRFTNEEVKQTLSKVLRKIKLALPS